VRLRPLLVLALRRQRKEPSMTAPSQESRSRYERFVEDILADVTAVDLANDPIFVIEHIRKAVAELRLLRSETASNRDAKDAARYRWLRAHHRTDVSHRLTWYLPRWASLDAAGLDAAIDGNLEDDAAESARNEYGGIGVARDGTDV
jgi:hypothetical protein